MLQRVMSQIEAVKKDMIILEKSEFSALLAENEVSSEEKKSKQLLLVGSQNINDFCVFSHWIN